jgi:hypothetical protein
MPRKKKRPKRERASPTFPARFAVGDRVRVKPGTTVPDFEDIPLGGWAGTITEVDQRSNPPTYLIEWDKHTLDHMHPVHRKRYERDGLELESMWLGQDDLEVDSSEPPVIEQPTNIVTRPLRSDDQDDRVRIALGLTSDDPLPDVDAEALWAYHRYLATHLSFPFQVKYPVEIGPFEQAEYGGGVVSEPVPPRPRAGRPCLGRAHQGPRQRGMHDAPGSDPKAARTRAEGGAGSPSRVGRDHVGGGEAAHRGGPRRRRPAPAATAAGRRDAARRAGH